MSDDARAVDVVNVTVAEAVPDTTAVVMLSAVAAAVTQPTHGVFTRPATVSLLVVIAIPSANDARPAARGCVVRPLQVTVTEPAGMLTPPPGKVTVMALLEMLVVHTVAADIKPHAGCGDVANKPDG